MESNNLSGWQCWTGTNTTGTLNLSTFILGADPNRHKIVTTGSDPIIGSLVPMVIDGSYALRLGDQSITSPKAQIASYTFTVTSSNFSFMYALLMVDPLGDHTNEQKLFLAIG